MSAIPYQMLLMIPFTGGFMEEIICYTSHLPDGTKQNITFMELLLDERWSEGRLEYPRQIHSEIGNLNHKLAAKQNYEFLLRAAKKYSVTAIGDASHMNACSGQPDSPWESYRTDCYIAGKYQQELLSSGYFNPVMETLLQEAFRFPASMNASAWLEEMISHGPEYYAIDDDTLPILIYRGSEVCFNILDLFADEMAKELLRCRQRIEIFDVEKEGNPALTRLIGRRFKAVIGIQTHVFSILMQDKKTCLHDLIAGPKYNMILDHPAWMKEHISNGPKEYYLLTHDRNYLSFASRYYKNIKQSFYFPPGGVSLEDAAQIHPMPESAAESAPLPLSSSVPQTKQFDLTFIGSYYDYRKRLALIHSYNRFHRFLAARFLRFMCQNPDEPAEQAFQQALEHYRIHLNDEDFLRLFYEMRQVCFCAMTYYREKIIRTLLEAGITIHVYGDTWKNAPFQSCKNLIRHPAVSPREGLEIMERSRISLNIMSWHKDGLTERVLNAMLCQSAVLSDRSSILEDIFVNGQDLILFSLKQLDTLPALIRELLSDEERLWEITMSGYENARKNHRWKNRAKAFLQILEQSK